MATAQPQEISPLTLLGATPSGRVDIKLGYIQQAGQVFASIDGSRLLCYAQGFGDVYYMQVDTKPSEAWKKGRVSCNPTPAIARTSTLAASPTT